MSFIARGMVRAGVVLIGLLGAGTQARAQQIDIHGPGGSVSFGAAVAVLPNGNIVVTDPDGPVSNVGAVYLYSPAGVLISTLTGSTANDHVGSGGITVLANGNFVVDSPGWNNGVETMAGAVTLGNADTGISGVVSSANSLVGATANDYVGYYGGVVALGNGNYVVFSPYWDNGGTVDAGAVTWGSGDTGVTGVVSAANSLIGTTASDQVGLNGARVLSNGNYVVRSPYWDNGGMADAGAVTWGNGMTGVAGVVSAANSLIGTTANDYMGSPVVTALSNGNYVVASRNWDDGGTADVGAVTWGNGITGVAGEVSSANSLIGTTAADYLGDGGVTALSNGNYVVVSKFWHNGKPAVVGAVTWGNGMTGIAGNVSVDNSLIGTTDGDQVGSSGARALSNGNYVVSSPSWDNGGTADVGAATWGNGATGTAGEVSAANSLIGTTAGDQVGGATALSNGNYVVSSPLWDNGGTVDAGAATLGNGVTGTAGVVSAANSLVGTTADDKVAIYGANPLSNGNYVVRSPYWDNGGMADAGAATWGNGVTGVAGVVSAANSLVGTTPGDRVALDLTALSSGNYVVRSIYWDDGGIADAGAATFGKGATGIAGIVSAANSLVGTTADDNVGFYGIAPLSNGDYVVISPFWDNGGTADAGAMSLGRGSGGSVGPIDATNSVRGTVASGGTFLAYDYDAARDTLVVGQPKANVVSLFKADLLLEADFE